MAQVLSSENQKLLRTIKEQNPSSLCLGPDTLLRIDKSFGSPQHLVTTRIFDLHVFSWMMYAFSTIKLPEFQLIRLGVLVLTNTTSSLQNRVLRALWCLNWLWGKGECWPVSREPSTCRHTPMPQVTDEKNAKTAPDPSDQASGTWLQHGLHLLFLPGKGFAFSWKP